MFMTGHRGSIRVINDENWGKKETKSLCILCTFRARIKPSHQERVQGLKLIFKLVVLIMIIK